MLKKKVRLCAKLFAFFRGWILIRLTWNLSRFVPNSVEILTWIFRKKTISGKFFRNFLQTKAILYQNLWNFDQLSGILFQVRIALKKFTQVLSYVVAPKWAGTAITKSQKEDTGRKTRTFCFWKTCFVHSLSGTYHALLLGYFGLKFLPDVRHCVCWVLAEIWVSDSSHKMGNKFFNHHCQGERKVRLCAKLLDFFRGWILIHLTWNFSCFVPISLAILTWIFKKKLFWDNFSEILCKPRLSSTKTCEISPYILQFNSRSVLRWKNSHKYFHMLFAPRWGGTSVKKSQKEDTRKKSQDFLFSENQFCSLSVGDLTRITPWVLV